MNAESLGSASLSLTAFNIKRAVRALLWDGQRG